jgi:hypothetical protein
MAFTDVGFVPQAGLKGRWRPASKKESSDQTELSLRSTFPRKMRATNLRIGEAATLAVIFMGFLPIKMFPP